MISSVFREKVKPEPVREGLQLAFCTLCRGQGDTESQGEAQDTSWAEANFVQQQDAAAELMSPLCEEKDLRRSCAGLHWGTITDLRSQKCLLYSAWLDGCTCLLRVGSYVVLHCYKRTLWSLCQTVLLIGSGQRRIDTSTSELILSYIFPEILVKSLGLKSDDDSCVSSHPNDT